MKKFSVNLESVYGSDFFYEFHNHRLYYQNGEFFALTQVSYSGHSGYYNVINSRPIAFYKVDFELEKVYYLGYAKGWYEFITNNVNKVMDEAPISFKVVKTKGE